MSEPKPVLPRNPQNPIGDGRILTISRKKIRVAMRKISRDVLALYNQIPRSFVDVEVNHRVFQISQRVYRYETDPSLLATLPMEIQAIIDRWLLEDGVPSWFMYTAVDQASTVGMAEGVVSLQNLTPAYTTTVEQMLVSQPFQNRLQFVRSRVFNEMENLSVDMKTNLNRILTNGMTNGFGPRRIAQEIHQQIGLPEWNDGKNKASYARALRISRTETNMSHREARWFTADDAEERLGIKTKQLWFSALSPTTRRTHAEKHGDVLTTQKVKEFYSKDGNAINCRCGQSQILVDDEGNPIDTALVDRTKERGDQFFKMGGGES